MITQKNPDNEEPAEERSNKYSSPAAPYGKILLAVVAVLVIAGLAWLWIVKPATVPGVPSILGNPAESGPDSLKIDPGKYQAVFLTNGEVYFGKIQSHDNSYLELTDIYYIQVTPVLQQGQENQNKNDNKNQQPQQNQISLVKLGNELHGPMDQMTINKNLVAYVENLKDDSKVTQAINQYIKDQQK